MSQLYIIPCWNNFYNSAKSSGSFGASWALDIVTFLEKINKNYGWRTHTVLRVKCDFCISFENKIDECSNGPYFTSRICFDHYFSPDLIISARFAYVLWTHIKNKNQQILLPRISLLLYPCLRKMFQVYLQFVNYKILLSFIWHWWLLRKWSDIHSSSILPFKSWYDPHSILHKRMKVVLLRFSIPK
jgi:hypothetical protein